MVARGIDSHGRVADARANCWRLLADNTGRETASPTSALPMGDRGAVRGAQAALGSEAAAEGANHESDGDRGPDAIALMPIVDADLRAALRVQAFEIATGEPRTIVVSGYAPIPQG